MSVEDTLNCLSAEKAMFPVNSPETPLSVISQSTEGCDSCSENQANHKTEKSNRDYFDLLVQQNEIIKQQERLIQQQKQQIELQFSFMKQNFHKNITQTNQETSKLAPYNCTDTENSSFVGDHLQSEETNKSNDFMHNQIKEAEILYSPACSDQYQSNQQVNQSYDIHPVIQQTCLSDSTNPSNLPFQERCSLKVSSHEYNEYAEQAQINAQLHLANNDYALQESQIIADSTYHNETPNKSLYCETEIVPNAATNLSELDIEIFSPMENMLTEDFSDIYPKKRRMENIESVDTDRLDLDEIPVSNLITNISCTNTFEPQAYIFTETSDKETKEKNSAQTSKSDKKCSKKQSSELVAVRSKKRPFSMTCIKTMKGPYLEFNVEEEFLLTQLTLVKDQLSNDVVKEMRVNEEDKYFKYCDVFLDIVEGKESSWRKYKGPPDEGKEVLMKIVKGYGNSLIPTRFGRFPENFLVKVLEYSYDIACQIDQAVFFSMDTKGYADLYSQNMDNICWSEENKEFIEEKLSHFKNYPPVEPESLVCFKSPWCSSYDDEIFYMDTMRSLGQKYRKYPKLIGITMMMCCILQPENSPFAKNKNLQRFMKELATLMNRYITSVNPDPAEASQETEEIISLVMNMERCADIFINKTLE